MKNIIRIESVTQIHDFLGLPKPKHPLVSLIPYNENSAEIDLGDDTYVMNLFQVGLKAGISGKFTYGRNSYDFQEGTMYFVRPEQTLNFEDKEKAEDPCGWVLVFHPDLIRKSELGQTIDDYTFFSYEVHEALHLSDDEKKWVTEIVKKIEKEYSQNIDRHSQKLIISNIELLLDYCTRYYDRQFYTRTNLNKDTFSRFEALLKNYYKNENQLTIGIPTVTYCGKELNMSPNYLSDLLKKETGKNAKNHIDDFLINKAKNLLLSSTDSVSEIAFSLGFEYSQHFSKMFKAKSGMSPSQYRSLN